MPSWPELNWTELIWLSCWCFVSDDTLFPLLALVKEYQVDHIRTKCEQYIGIQLELGVARSGQGLDTDRLLLFLAACDQHSLHQHRERLQQLAAKRPTAELISSIKKHDCFPANSAVEVLITRCKKVDEMEQALRKVKKTVSDSHTKILNFQEKCGGFGSCHSWGNLCSQCVQRKLKGTFEDIDAMIDCVDWKFLS